jgi:hypothetical protein
VHLGTERFEIESFLKQTEQSGLTRILVLNGCCAVAPATTCFAGREGQMPVGAKRGIFSAATLPRFCESLLNDSASTEDAAMLPPLWSEVYR